MCTIIQAPDLRRVRSHPDFWYPVAWSRDLKPGKVLATTFAGDPIAVVRPAQGPVYALEDRCAHRQVPLSGGVVAECGLRCGYHGWTYNSTGACVDVPYLRGKMPNGVKAYPCREQAGVIFVFPGDPSLANEVPFPDLTAAQDKAFRTRRFGQVVKCHYSFMHENLMDMNHQFLHRKQMGYIRPRYRGLRNGPGRIEVDYSFAREGGKQPWGEAAILGQRRGTAVGQFRDLMTIRTEYPYQTLNIWTDSDAPVMNLWIAYTPQDKAQRANRTFGLLSVRRPKPGFLLDLGWPALVWFTDRIFTEDREIVEQEQAAHDRQGRDCNQELFPPILALRDLLLACGVPEQPEFLQERAREFS
jgi:phenylpropionate dioxygenase-like ring-hydroxylating dioxygenase large terminal subunit